MNNIFDLQRFGMLFRRHTVENFRYYLMSLAVFSGILILIFSFLFFTGRGNERVISENSQFGVFIVFLLLGGTIYTSTIFGELSEKKHAIASLTLPASINEKFLTAWVYTAIIFPLLFTICFYCVDWIFISVISRGSYQRMINVFSDPFFPAFFFYALLNSIVLWGAIFFEKLHFIKTAFVVFIAALILTAFSSYLIKSIIPGDVHPTIPFSGFSIFSDRYFFVQLQEEQRQLFFGLVISTMTVLFWLAAWFRVKEKEV